jgi:hypothetical protein
LNVTDLNATLEGAPVRESPSPDVVQNGTLATKTAHLSEKPSNQGKIHLIDELAGIYLFHK